MTTTHPAAPFRWTFYLAMLGLSAALAFAAYRSGRLLTFDGYHYCEFTKQFTSEWPDRFGNHWPFGYMLLGSLLGRLGLPAFESLCVVSFLALAALLGLALKVAPPRRVSDQLLLLALACAPIVGVQLLGNLTELPFGAVLLGLIVSFGYWPRRSALWCSALLVVSALSIRYAGILTLSLFAGWIVVMHRSLRESKALGTAVAAFFSSAAVILLLLGLNILKSGHASGAERGVPLGFSALPAQFVDLGWSAPGALLAGGLRDRCNPETTLGSFLGGLLFLAMVLLCVCAWFKPQSAYTRPLAWVTLGYLFGMGALRCIGNFDALFAARTFLPVLFPLGLLFREQAAQKQMAVFGCSAILLLGGITAAARGVSREIAGDVRAAIAPLQARLGPADRIAINDHAFSLAAYLHQRTVRAFPGVGSFPPAARFLVVTGEPLNRSGKSAPLPPEWRSVVAELLRQATYRELINTPTLVVMERATSEP